MRTQKITTHEELMEEFEQDPEFRRQQRLIRPFYRIAVEIIKLRNKLGLTQKQLAKLANTHQTRISKIESSELDIRLSTLAELAEALGCQVAINFMPFSDMVYQEELGEPYKSFFQAKIQQDTSPVVYYINVNGYQTGPVTEGLHDQCN